MTDQHAGWGHVLRSFSSWSSMGSKTKNQEAWVTDSLGWGGRCHGRVVVGRPGLSDRNLSACLGWWERAASRLLPVVVAGCPCYVFSLGKQREGRPRGFLTAAAAPSAEHTKLQLP